MNLEKFAKQGAAAQVAVDAELSNAGAVNHAQEVFARMRSVQSERRAEAMLGIEAMLRLVDVMKHRTGQGYKLRQLFYSLWNGKPACLNEILGLDWELRKDFSKVVLAWGFEDKEIKFFYRAIEEALQLAGLFNWFLEERLQVDALRDYVSAIEREQQ
jgi:hypothetical protein